MNPLQSVSNCFHTYNHSQYSRGFESTIHMHYIHGIGSKLDGAINIEVILFKH